MSGSNDPLLQPFALKGLRLRNRIVSTSHAISYVEDGMPKDRYQLYHAAKAQGGIGMTMFGGSSNVSADSASVFGQINIGTDRIIPYLQQFSRRVHKAGSALMCQITHMGGRTHWRADSWLPVLAPSHYRESLHRAVSKEMDRYDIDRIVKAFGDAAMRCKEGGLDGVEVLGHGHLVGQFWSPLVNRRQDEFGGSVENRARFGAMVLEEIRRRVGPDYIVSLRMMMGEGFEGGITDEDSLAFAQTYDRAGLVDILNLNYGRADTPTGLAEYMPGMQGRLSPHLERVRRFRSSLSAPVIHACRVNDTATARHAVRDGIVDLIGMTRAHIADPNIVDKISSGQEERIRPCVGATYCSWQKRCIHNPAIGREQSLPHIVEPAADRRRVVVVGAGPGGLEAARVSAARGHEVIVFEAAAQAGGQVLLASRVPARRDLIGIIDWRLAECERMGVTFRYNSFADPDEILRLDPDYVVVATGGLPDSPLPESDTGLCQSTWEAIENGRKPSGVTLVYDTLGTMTAATYAEKLMQDGCEVIYVTPDMHVGYETSHLDRPFLLKHFYQAHARVISDSRVVGVRRCDNRLEALVHNIFNDETSPILIDNLVYEAGTVPAAGIYEDLRGRSRNNGVTDVEALANGEPQDLHINPDGHFVLHRIGDAVASRDIHAAILDALRLCKDF